LEASIIGLGVVVFALAPRLGTLLEERALLLGQRRAERW